jgi:hypothetical protein
VDVAFPRTLQNFDEVSVAGLTNRGEDRKGAEHFLVVLQVNHKKINNQTALRMSTEGKDIRGKLFVDLPALIEDKKSPRAKC